MHYAVEPSLIPKIKLDYIKGKGSVREIAESYGVANGSTKTVLMRAFKEKWKKQREQYLASVSEKGLKEAETEVDEWLRTVKSDSKQEWKYITESIRSLVESGQGVDSDTMVQYMRARKLIDDMHRRSLGLRDTVDVTSGGQSLSESIVSAIDKLRQDPSKIVDVTSEQVDMVLEMEIEDPIPPKPS